MFQRCLTISFLVLLSNVLVDSVVLRAFISQHGLHGEIEFSQKSNHVVSIRTNLEPTLEFPDQIWHWEIRKFPVDYSEISEDRCSDTNLGDNIINLTDELGFLTLPGNESTEYESNNDLTGENGFWGKSLVLKSPENSRVLCATIVSNDRTVERVADVKFHSPIAGSIYFRWIASKEFDKTDILIQSDLYHVQDADKNVTFTEHRWKVYVTDIFDTDSDKSEENCNILQLVYDPENKGVGKGVGDIDNRLGKLKISVDPTRGRNKMLYKDDGLKLLPSDLGGPRRRLYIVIFDDKHPNSFLACGKIKHHHARYAKALINLDGIKGEVEFKQQSKFDPTWVSFNISSSDGLYESALKYAGSVLTYEIMELPVSPQSSFHGVSNLCNTSGNIYNPKSIDNTKIPPSGMGTQDQYSIGDLFGKLKDRTKYLIHKYLLPSLSNELSGMYWDVFLPLQGPNSVIHKTLTIKRYDDKPAVCGSIALYDQDTKYQTQMFTAEVILRYPLVGRVILRQPKNEPWADTSILFEYLVHADGANINNTFEHRWAIHESPPNQDFYNWTGRCLSARSIYNPYKVTFDPRTPETTCNFIHPSACRMGDLSTRHGTLGVAGKKSNGAKISRKMFTDPMIPLSGPHSVVGKSLVIYDDHGPVARGERMACSIIGAVFRRKAVIKDWYPNGNILQVRGDLELIQQTEYDITNIEVDLEGLINVSDYHIHLTPVEESLNFPCEPATLYDTLDPLNVGDNSRNPGEGTTDQYKLGDLSGKFGTLLGQKKMMNSFNDSQISLFGPRSILGRSVVIHEINKHQPWACSSIERGYSPSEARELRAIASFHHPAGFAYGYVRMTQLIHSDKSQSDTIIEVNLRYPGERDRNNTRDHKWAIFVNPVGVDATVQTTATRCVAGGYRWNPYFTQLADPLNEDLYNQECGADNPLRCHVGDLTSRLGTIDIGHGRQMFTDSIFPLEGTVNALGRSIVIMGANHSSEKFACANIEPDYDIVKYANIRKPPRFVVTQFIEDIRHVMGVPEWMLTVDSRKTKTLHQESCIQFLLHFKGPHAGRIEQDFTKLLATGKLDEATISVPGFVNQKRKKKIFYRQCGVRDPTEKPKRFSILSSLTGSSTMNISENRMVIFVGFLIILRNYGWR